MEITTAIIAVVPLRIDNMFELDSRDAYAKREKGRAVLIILKIKIFFRLLLKCLRYFFCSKKGRKIRPATASLILTSAIGPSSGVAIFINIKALPQTAPRIVIRIQYLFSMID